MQLLRAAVHVLQQAQLLCLGLQLLYGIAGTRCQLLPGLLRELDELVQGVCHAGGAHLLLFDDLASLIQGHIHGAGCGNSSGGCVVVACWCGWENGVLGQRKKWDDLLVWCCDKDVVLIV